MIAIDIETSPGEDWADFEDAALDHNRNKIDLIAVWGDGIKEVFTSVVELNNFLKIYRPKEIVGHNLKFDFKTLITKGADLSPAQMTDDTSLMAVSLSEKITEEWLNNYEIFRKMANQGQRKAIHRQAGRYSLKTLAPYFLGVERFWEVADHNNIEYALKDAEYTYRLYFELKKRLEKEDSFEFYKTKLIPWAQMILEAEMAGVRLDFAEMATEENKSSEAMEVSKRRLDELWADAHKVYRDIEVKALAAEYKEKEEKAIFKLKDKSKADQTRARYLALYSKAVEKIPQSINIGSPSQLAWLFKDYLKLDITDFDGEESTGKPVLQKLAGEGRQDIQEFLSFRTHQKLLTAFYPSYRSMAYQGILHTNFNLTGTRTGRLSSSSPNCLSMDTEVLTNNGFKTFSELHKSDLVALYKEDGEIKWETPEGYLYIPQSDEDIIEYTNEHITFRGTSNHRNVFKNRKTGKIKISPAKNPLLDSKWIHSGQKQGGITVPAVIIQLAVAIQADGSKASGNRYDFTFSKKRKIDRFISLFSEYICANIKGPRYRAIINANALMRFNLLDDDKCFNINTIANLDRESLKIFLDELHHWDGLFTRKNAGLMYTSKHKKNADAVQLACTLYGYRAHLSVDIVDERPYYRVYGTYRDYSLTSNMDVKNLGKTKEPVWCLKVSTGMFIVRRNGNTFVTGNCQQVPSHLHKLFVSRPGKTFLCYDLSGIEPVVIAYLTEDPIICDILINGRNFHNHNTRVFFGLTEEDKVIKEKYKKERDLAKEVGLALLYGAGPRRLQQSAIKRGFNWSYLECRSKYQAFREEYEHIYNYKTKLDKALEKGQSVENILGRKVKIMKADDVYMTGFNTLVQSSASDLLLQGVWKAKQEAGPDFRPLLFVHDECVIEVPEDKAEDMAKILLKNICGFELKSPYGRIPIEAEGGIAPYWKK